MLTDSNRYQVNGAAGAIQEAASTLRFGTTDSQHLRKAMSSHDIREQLIRIRKAMEVIEQALCK